MRRWLCGIMILASLDAASAADLAGTLANQRTFGKLLEAARAAGLEPVLQRKGPYTLFAPTDAAFGAMSASVLAWLMKPGNKQELAKVLSFHLIVGRVEAKDWADRKIAAKSAAGLPLTISGEQGRSAVNGVVVSKADLASDNGVIHVIDQVLVPPISVAPRT